MLCVQRTGWGKSAVYFLATALLREAGAGPTLIVSPLLALMRNQIAAAERIGIRAHTVNSTNRDAWAEVRDLLAADAVDVLLISPERLNNPQFRAEMLPLFAERVGLLVIDEAHCISDWGHDFRPDYRRIADMLERLPEGVPVLCTTATANDRVVADVEEQLSIGRAAALRTYRGPLGRSSLRFEVVDLPGQADRLAWLAQHLPDLPGSGIVYTLTKRDADLVAEWLNGHGVAAEAYSGDSATDDRVAVEERLLRNDLKAVVATSALGMGYDKPDLGFVVHYQAPGSRDRLLPAGRPRRPRDRARRGRAAARRARTAGSRTSSSSRRSRAASSSTACSSDSADGDGATTQALMAEVNLGKGRVEAMLKVLDVEGAVERDGSRWLARAGSGWAYDAERYERITALRRREQAAMAQLGADGRCLMRALQEELDDPAPDGLRALLGVRRPALRRAARPGAGARGGAAPALAPAGARGQEDGARRRGRDAQDPRGVRAEEGRALARLGDGGWDPLVRAGPQRRAASTTSWSAAAAEVVRGWGVAGPRGSPRSPRSAAASSCPASRARSPSASGSPFAPVLERVADGPPQREMANSHQQVANVRGAFAVTAAPPPGAGLLVDDIRFSGWTLAMVAGQLRGKGADAVYPLALSTAF